VNSLNYPQQETTTDIQQDKTTQQMMHQHQNA